MFKFVDEYRDVDICLDMAAGIRKISKRPMNIMEVCGGHTMSIRKNGVHKMVGDNIKLISGPGCPVCVTSIRDIDKAIALSKTENVAVCTFGDMLYVPGTTGSLAGARAEGADVRTVYSPHDALKFADSEPEKEFVLISIGFETTAPTAAACVVEAGKRGLENFSVLSLNKTMPEALKAVLGDESCKIDALICPGHVSAITGTAMYRPVVDDLGISCCVAGFEPADLLRAIYLLAETFEKGESALINAYERAVKEEGNAKARYIMMEVFDPCDAEWRGCGVIPASGLKINDDLAAFDAEKKFDLQLPEAKEVPGCICGDILRGTRQPVDCPLFGNGCDPMAPKGACMVSSEGTCAAWYKYRD